MTTLERRRSATAIALLVWLWNARTSGPHTGRVPGSRVFSHRMRPRGRRDTRRATLTRRAA